MSKILTREDYFKYHSIDANLQQVKKSVLEKYPDKVKNVTYFRLFDNSSFILATNQNWFENWLFHFDSFNTTLFNKKIQETAKKEEYVYCVWSYFIKDLVLEFNHDYRINAGFDIYKKQKDYVEVFSISGEEIEELHDYCINNLEYLHNTMHKMSSITYLDNSYRVVFPIHLDMGHRISKKSNSRLILNNTEIHFTEKEMICMRKIAKGYTMKAIGEQLNISPRTVEGHINNIKLKVGCSYKSDLIDIIHSGKIGLVVM